jgi:AcrR family transcriptional regulator
MNSRRRAPALRNPPRQARSKATVGAILDAMTRILDREGMEASTTTRIAAVAGISIGTLYQYFSDREAILDALQNREFERAMELMQKVLSSGQQTSAREVSRRVMHGLLELYASAPGLHRALIHQGLTVTPSEHVQAFDMRVVAVIRSFLSTSGLPIRRTRLDAAAFVIFQSVRAAMLARLLEAPPGLSDEVLVEELTDMALRYLVEEGPARGR